MLKVLSTTRRACSGPTRRELLQIGGAGLFGISLPRVLAAEAARGVVKPRARSVMFVYLFGGPSQLETFDMKPDAPEGIRGPFRPIASRTSDLRICEHLPKLAAISDKYCVVRTMTHPHNDHNACHYIQTGHPLPPAPRGASGVDASTKDWPAIGSVVSYLDRRSSDRREFPSYLYLPNRLGHIDGYDRPGQYGGWLGNAYNGLATEIRKRGAKDNPYFRACTDDELDFRIQGLAVAPEITLDRLNKRRRLIEQFDAEQRRIEATVVSTFNQFRQQAFSLISSDKISQAFDIRRESDQLRDRYGRHLFGQSALMGRRMIEAGTRFVTVLWDGPGIFSWDSHYSLTPSLKNHLLPGLDQGLSALLEDMDARGLLDETLVVCLGEMGRTPTFKSGSNADGRDHWSHCFPCVLAGAGIRGGLAYGRSDKDAAYVIERPVTPEDLACTIFDALGIDPHAHTLKDPQGRPMPLVDGGRPLRELFA